VSSPGRQGARLNQIDLLKGLAIVAVLVLHGLPIRVLRDSWEGLHVRQAVPVFVVLMGMNSAASFTKRGWTGLRDLYLRGYLADRARRIVVPLAIAYGASLVLGLALGRVHIGPLAAVGVLPLSGPGNYFVTLLLETVLAFPLIYWCYRRRPVLTLVGCFVLDAGWELIAGATTRFDSSPYLYDSSVLRYLAMLALGMWIADSAADAVRRNVIIAAGAVIGLGYLVMFDSGEWYPTFVVPGFGLETNALTAFYPALLVLAGLRWLPRAPGTPVGAALAFLGRASFHVFLVQILWFGAWGAPDSARLPLDIVACLVLGSLFYALVPSGAGGSATRWSQSSSTSSVQSPRELSRRASR
jgi:peptidoglycan/LPS O-acetylase OafA/YrhL